MGKIRKEMAERILNLSLEIICLLTGEDYTAVKKSLGECLKPSFRPRVSGGWSRTQSPNMEPSPHCLMYDNTDQKILDLTNKMIELLTGEDP
ncbi:oocyte zinc finger protein XlCOF29-like isoform 2-T3 [Anomaloglossus baeobatrachus]